MTECTKFTKSTKFRPLIDANLFGACITLRENYLDPLLAKRILSEADTSFQWIDPETNKVKVAGRGYVKVPRRQAAYGDPGTFYSFAGTKVDATPWEQCPLILQVRQEIEKRLDMSFNFVLINRYADGNDHIGFHQDSKKDLVPGAPIVSYTVGQERDFVLQRSSDSMRFQGPLRHNTLLVMAEPTNTDFLHSVPKRSANVVPGVRYNFTWRMMTSGKSVTLFPD